MSYISHNPLAATSPLRSAQWGRAAYEVMGWTPAMVARWNLDAARKSVAIWADRFGAACRSLGEANRLRYAPNIRRMYQGKALRSINGARRELRAARARLVAAELAMTALATVQA